MPTRRQFLAASLPLLGTLACRDPLSGAPKATKLPLRPSWGTDPAWGDGAAEIARYDGTLSASQAPLPFQATIVTLREPFNLEKLAKSDRGAAGKRVADAIRVTLAFDAPAPSGPAARFFATMEILADSPGKLLRQAVSSHEWDGISHKEFARHGGSGRYLWRTPWEADGSGERPIPLDAAHLTEEQLLPLARALDFKAGLKFAAAVYPSQLGNRAPSPEPQAMKFEVSEGADFMLDGKPLKTWKIEARSSGKKAAPRKLAYVVGKEFPHPLLSFEASDGRSLKLASLQRGAAGQIGR